MSGDVKNNLKCYICNSRAGVSIRNAVQIFNDQNKLQWSTKTLVTAINDIVGANITKQNAHSCIVCKKCFKLFEEYDELEYRLNEIKTDLTSQFRKTLPLYDDDSVSKSNANNTVVESGTPSVASTNQDAVKIKSDPEVSPGNVKKIPNLTLIKKMQPLPCNVVIVGYQGKKITLQKQKAPSILKNTAKPLNLNFLTPVKENQNNAFLFNDPKLIEEVEDNSESDKLVKDSEQHSSINLLNMSDESDKVMIDSEHKLDSECDNFIEVVETDDLLQTEDGNIICSSNNVEILSETIEHKNEEILLDFDIPNEDETYVKSDDNTLLLKKILPESVKVETQVVDQQGNELDDDSKFDDLFECMLCSKTTYSGEECNDVEADNIIGDAKSIMEHMRLKHDIKIQVCDLCGEIFKKKIELLHHLEEHTVNEQEGIFKCELCTKQFSSFKLLKVHRRLNHPNKIHECIVCKKQFGSKSLLIEHNKTHVGIRPFHCEICAKNFTSKYTYQSHLKTHMERPRPFTCAQCGKSFFTIQNLGQHEKTHLGIKDFVCNICGKAFGTQHNLEVHGVVHSGFKPYSCKVCGKSFARRAEIRDHERTHTGEKPYVCEMCGAKFSQRSNLQSHKRAKHFDDKRYKCPMCEKRFKRRRLLEYHIKASHTGERPHKCNLCGATFVYPEHFKKHQRIHSGVKPFECEVCGKTFNSRDNRNAHRFVHSDKKPYECLTCGAGFMRKPLLYAHMHAQGHLNDRIVVNQPSIGQKNTSKVTEENTFILDSGQELIIKNMKEETIETLADHENAKLGNNFVETTNVTIMPQHGKMFITDENGHLLEESDATELEKIEDSTEIIEEDCGSIITTDDVLDPESIEVIDEAGEQIIQSDDGPITIVQIKLADGVKQWVALNANSSVF